MSEEVITKRLHVSGLTPAISPKDLSSKLGSFGTVTALDGFGALNAVGEPRKFGYVTIETTKPKLAKCMNILSGVTWKGAKLRIGEAKPDFRERIAKEHEPPSEDTPPRKKRRLAKGVQGVHAHDMSLVTAENVADRGGWRVTPLGRIVRTVRMRPDHPLPDPLVKAAATKTQEKKKKKGAEKEKKRRPRDPPTRARRRTIDPTKWGSQHLKGAFLDNVVVSTGTHAPLADIQDPGAVSSDEEEVDSDEEVVDQGPEAVALEKIDDAASTAPVAVVTRCVSPPPPPPSKALVAKPATKESSDLREETQNTLGLLRSLFGGEKDADWGGAESLSDVDMNDVGEVQDVDGDAGDEVETVPRQVPDVVMKNHQSSNNDESEDDSESESDKEPPVPVAPSQAKPLVQKTKLKDLFAPREEEAGFSLLGHLDLDDDLDLDVDILGLNLGPSEPIAPTVVAPITAHAHPSRRFQISDFSVVDANAPLFFPMPPEDRGAQRNRLKDPLDVAKEQGWDWRTFHRTETDEEIKKRWEETKGDLTRDWKRRHREAVKSRRRRGGFGGDDHD